MSQTETNKLARWMIANSLATGHGDTLDDLLVELAWQVKELRVQAQSTDALRIALTRSREWLSMLPSYEGCEATNKGALVIVSIIDEALEPAGKEGE